MINSTAFNYVDVLTKAADSSWTREALIANNIANVDTVGYKRQDIDFQSVLSNELGNCKHKSLDSKIGALDVNELNPQVYTDSSNYSYSLNNIDKITINDKTVVNIPMKESYISGYKIPSSSFIYEFDEIETDEINIYLSSENIIYLNELMILGK